MISSTQFRAFFIQFIEPEDWRRREAQNTEYRWRQNGILPEPRRLGNQNYYPGDVIDRVFAAMKPSQSAPAAKATKQDQPQ